MKPLFSILALLLLSNCSFSGDDIEFVGVTVSLDASTYEVVYSPSVVTLTVPMTIVNASVSTVYVDNLGAGGLTVHLERKKGDEWTHAFISLRSLQFPEPLVISPGETYTYNAVYAASTDANQPVGFTEYPLSGTYRLNVAMYASWDRSAGYKAPLPEDARVSRSFEVIE